MKDIDPFDRRLDGSKVNVVSDANAIIHRSPVHLQLNVGFFGKVQRRCLVALDDQVFHDQAVEITVEIKSAMFQKTLEDANRAKVWIQEVSDIS